MWTRIILTVLIPILLLAQSVLVMHVHDLDHLLEHDRAPHIHWFDHHHNVSHRHDGNIIHNEDGRGHSHDNEQGESVYVLCYQFSLGHRLVLSELKTGQDFLLVIDQRELTGENTIYNNALTRHDASWNLVLLNAPDVIRNSLLRV